MHETLFATGITGYHPCYKAKIPSWYHYALQHDTVHGLQEQTSGKLMMDDAPLMMMMMMVMMMMMMMVLLLLLLLMMMMMMMMICARV